MTARTLFTRTAMASVIAVLGGSAAVAAPIDLGGYTGPITIDFSNYETFSATQTLTTTVGMTNYNITAPANGSQNFGIFQINDVKAGGFGANILNMSQYTYVGVFYGIDTQTATAFGTPDGVGFNATTTGGTFVLYQIPNSDINLTTAEKQGLAGYTSGGCGGNPACYNLITNATGATAVLDWGVGTNSLSPTYTLFDPNLGKTINTGSASGTATVVGGTDQSQFGPNVFVEDDFCFNGGGGTAQCGAGTFPANNPADNWPLLSNDPVDATAVPEPGSLALFGSQLVALAAFVGWRRKRHSGSTSKNALV